MPILEVEDPATKRVIEVEVPEGTTPTLGQMHQILAHARANMGASEKMQTFAGADQAAPPPPREMFEGGDTRGAGVSGSFDPLSPAQKAVGAVMPYARPVVEGVGMAGGGMVGAPLGPAGAVGGAALGYGMGKQAMDAAGRWAAGQDQPNLPQSAANAARDVVEGATYEMGGQAVGAGLGMAANTAPAKWVMDKIGGGIANLLGITTNASPQAIKEAYRAGKEGVGDFGKAISGKLSGEDVVNAVRQAATNMKQARGEAYRESLERIAQDKGPVDLTPVKSRLSKLMGDFNISETPTGALDFTRSRLDSSEADKVAKIITMVKQWGSREGDTTALMMDTLKQKIDDAIPATVTKNSRAFISGLRDSVKRSIVEQVPEYARMTEEYAKATRAVNEAERALSIRPSNMPETSLGKVLNALKEDKEFRGKALDALQQFSGQDLRAMVAGKELSPYIPKGQLGAMTRLGILGAGAPMHPAAAAALSPLVSPHAMGLAAQGAGSIARVVPSMQPILGAASLQGQRALNPGME